MSTESFVASEVEGAANIACPDSNQTEAAHENNPSSDVAISSRQSRADLGDRRKPSLRSFLYGAFNPRRRSIRREEDNDQTYLDWHPTHLIVVGSAILILSVIDGLLTLYLAHNGVIAFNSLSVISGENGLTLFTLGKFAITAAAVVGLVLTAHMKIYRFIKASTVLYVFLGVYLFLVINQGMLARVMV